MSTLLRSTFLLLLGAIALLSMKTVVIDSSQTKEGRQLLWADEFEVDGLPDSTKWGYDTGGHGWGNNELQYYTANRAENARIEDGKLIIEAHKESFGEKEYTSARLVTRGKQHFSSGLIEARAKLPTGKGTWPAVWMLGASLAEHTPWPDCGEIDIMEHVGYAPDSIYGTIHCKSFNHMIGTQKMGALPVLNAEEDFHTYAVDWNAEQITFLVDGLPYHRFPKPDSASHAEWPFDDPHYLLLNLAVGGNWGGKHGVDTTIWPQRLEVDWVRVWGSAKE